jgi:hypothetical protein
MHPGLKLLFPEQPRSEITKTDQEISSLARKNTLTMLNGRVIFIPSSASRRRG